jgi:hypothetical protein
MTDIPVPQIIIEAIRLEPGTLPHLSDDALKIVKAAGYDGIRTVLHGAVFGSVFGYLSGSGYVAIPKQRMALAVSEAYIEAAEIAWVDAGAELPLDDDTATWARTMIEAQFTFIDELFEKLKELRKSGDFDAGEVAIARADGYANSLDGFFSEAKMRASENITLEFGGSDGKESCKDCQRLKGKRHKIKYILEHNLIPRPGNTSFECGGWQCEHFWFNPKTGEEFKTVLDLEKFINPQ